MRIYAIVVSALLVILAGFCSQVLLRKSGYAGSAVLYAAPQLPSSLSFAGEKVPVNETDIAERLDREILLNAYFHSNTLLGIKRMARYLPELEKVLQEQGIPEDFSYLALAESMLTNSVSPAGAASFWQLMPDYAREAGLLINDEIDERYHLAKATRAAAAYFQKAKNRFGTWTLAAASYNRGMSGLQQALQKQQVASFYDLYLNDETSRYLFRILALKEVLSNPGNYGFSVDDALLYQPFKTKTVTITQTVPDLVAFAKSQGTNYKTLRLLNPWLRAYSLTLETGQQFELQLPE